MKFKFGSGAPITEVSQVPFHLRSSLKQVSEYENGVFVSEVATKANSLSGLILFHYELWTKGEGSSWRGRGCSVYFLQNRL